MKRGKQHTKKARDKNTRKTVSKSGIILPSSLPEWWGARVGRDGKRYNIRKV